MGHSTEPDAQLPPSIERRFLGLSSTLWRLCLVVTIIQFGSSVWSWQFPVLLNDLLEEWKIGSVFSLGTAASLLGYPVAGALSDYIGRKRAFLVGILPIFVGTAALSITQEWPLVLVEYSLTTFGWSFVIMAEKSMAADVVMVDKGLDSARTFSMVIAPAAFADGAAPLVATLLLVSGVTQLSLITIGAAACGASLLAAPLVLKETLATRVMNRARAGPRVPLRRYGRVYWKLAAGMAGFYFATGMTLSYFSIIMVDEWYLDLPMLGLTWSALSLTMALLTYSISGVAERNLRASLLVAVTGNWALIAVCGIGQGVLLAFALNFAWAPILVLWYGAENSIVSSNVSEELKGRAMGTYTLLMSSLNVVAAPLGAILWTLTGSLRSVYIAATLGSTPLLLLMGLLMRSVRTGERVPRGDRTA